MVVDQGYLLRFVAGLSLLLAASAAGCGTKARSMISTQRPAHDEVNSSPIQSLKSERQIAEQFSIPDPSPSEPVLVRMMFDPPFGAAGESAELIVYVRIARAHFLHSSGDEDSIFSPVEMRVQFPMELQTKGNWQRPQPGPDSRGQHVFRDAVMLRCPVKVASDAPNSELTVKGQLSFQVCTDELCWPRRLIEVSAPFTIQSRRR